MNHCALQIELFLALIVGGLASKAPMDQYNQSPVIELPILLPPKICPNPGPGGLKCAAKVVICLNQGGVIKAGCRCVIVKLGQG